MSLDIHLSDVVETEVFWQNITHNVNKMWRKAGVYEALYESHGKRAGEFVEILEAGLEDMLNNFGDYKKLDAENGWGKTEHAIRFLYFTLKAFKQYPNGTIGVSR